MKELKDKNVPVIGAYCTYFPQEIAMAMGAVTVGLCSTSDETIPVAEKDLPRNLCPMVKASYGFAVSDKCPFLDVYKRQELLDFLVLPDVGRV